MQLLIKFSGLALILFVSTAVGFLRASGLKIREKRLFELYLCMNDLKERIRLEGDELSLLLEKSLGDKVKRSENGGFFVSVNGITPEDGKIINEYLSSAGMSDPDAEYERAELYALLIKKQHSAAEEDCDRLCRLYRTVGFMAGMFICIFLV